MKAELDVHCGESLQGKMQEETWQQYIRLSNFDKEQVNRLIDYLLIHQLDGQ